jgi:hypothetical protein
MTSRIAGFFWKANTYPRNISSEFKKTNNVRNLAGFQGSIFCKKDFKPMGRIMSNQR